MVMTLNSIRRWCFITKNDVRWTVFLTILCVWCSVCGGVSSPTTTAPTTPVLQTASEVCIIKTKASITTAMTPKQNQKCTAVTFTITPPTTTVSTNEASTEYPTTATVSLTTDSTATENIASTEKPSSTITSEAYTTTDVTPTTNSELTTVPPATENAAPTTALSSSTTTISPSITPLVTTTTRPPTATTFVTPTTMPVFSEITTFLTTTSLKNATQISVTDNPAQSTISLATTATSAPTLIIVTQETTMSLSMSTTDASPTTIVTPLTTTTQTIAVVNSTLLFSSSSPVPSEAQVLTAIKTLRQSRESQLSDSVKVVNVTYQKISETSYAVVFTFNLNNISMPVDSDLRGDTYQKVQNTINNALNTLLNEPGKQVFVPKTSNFMSTSNQIDGSMEYTFQDGDAIQPVSFLNELRSQTVVTTASPLSTIITSPPTLLGRVIIYIRLMFVTSGPLPNEKDIVQVANTLLYSRVLTKLRSRAQPLSDPVNFANITYTKINETAYTLNLGFEISNVSMSEKLEFRNETYLTIQDSINTLLNKILNDDSAPAIKFQPGDFTEFSGNSTTIQASVTYVFSNSSITQPSIFIQELLQVIKESTLTTASTSATTPQPISKVFIKIRLVFVTLGPIPSESDVLRVVKSILASNLTTKITSRAAVIPSNPVIKTDVIYSKINDTAYALDFEFEINSLSVNDGQRNQAYVEIQNKINNLVIEILNNPSAVLPMIQATFTDSTSSSITANVTYVFSQSDSNSYTAFGRLVGQLFITFTTPAPTTINTTVSNNSTNAAWVVAIIVPVAIVLGLIPCWILLCCLLCGCCAAIRRRWHRRQSYNMQYTTRNSLF